MNQLYYDQCRRNAEAFVAEYLHIRDEKGEAHSFWDRFFEILVSSVSATPTTKPA